MHSVDVFNCILLPLAAVGIMPPAILGIIVVILAILCAVLFVKISRQTAPHRRRHP